MRHITQQTSHTTDKMALVKKSDNDVEYTIAPTKEVAKINYSEWPLLLKNWDQCTFPTESGVGGFVRTVVAAWRPFMTYIIPIICAQRD